MTENTKIEWATHTFNTHWGCTEVSPGCDNCYARDFARRFGVGWGPKAERRTFGAKHWNEPLRWDRMAMLDRERAAAAGIPHERPRVFCDSMADGFDKDPPAGVRERLFELIHRTPELDWLLLTKRIGNVLKMVPSEWTGWRGAQGGFPRNLWIGASVVNQEEADRDIAKLRAIPARVRFLSLEPMLEGIRLPLPIPDEDGDCEVCGLPFSDDGAKHACPPGFGRPIDWVIVGGESGAKARPFDVGWARSVVEQCKAADVACFVKQLGAEPITDGIQPAGCWWPEHVKLRDSHQGLFHVRLRDRKGGDISEWPSDLRVRQFPTQQVAA